MDIYIPEQFNNRQTPVILVHGGAWKYGNKIHLRSIQKFLLKNNIPSFNINYRLLNDSIRYQQQLDDIARAVKHISTNAGKYGIKTEKYIIIGESAGGHLSLLYGYQNSHQIEKIISLSGPTDFYSENFKDSFYFKQSRRIFEKVVGGSYSKSSDEEIFKAASPVAQVSNVPTLIFQGGKDPLVNRKQGLALDSILKSKNVPHKLVYMPNSGHVPRLLKKKRETIIYP